MHALISEVKDEDSVRTREEAQQAIKKMREENYSGGGTNISHAIRTTCTRIEEIMASEELVRPELVVVTDGEDEISLTPEGIM